MVVCQIKSKEASLTSVFLKHYVDQFMIQMGVAAVKTVHRGKKKFWEDREIKILHVFNRPTS